VSVYRDGILVVNKWCWDRYGLGRRLTDFADTLTVHQYWSPVLLYIITQQYPFTGHLCAVSRRVFAKVFHMTAISKGSGSKIVLVSAVSTRPCGIDST